MAEEDDLAEYATLGVNVARLVEQTVVRLEAGLQPHGTALASYAIRHLLLDTPTKKLDDAVDARLCATKVAVSVARRLFQKQSAPWDRAKFLSKWQARMPGVGPEYQVRPLFPFGRFVCGVSWQKLLYA